MGYTGREPYVSKFKRAVGTTAETPESIERRLDKLTAPLLTNMARLLQRRTEGKHQQE